MPRAKCRCRGARRAEPVETSAVPWSPRLREIQKTYHSLIDDPDKIDSPAVFGLGGADSYPSS